MYNYFWWLATDSRIPVLISSGAAVLPVLETVSICFRNLIVVTELMIVLLPTIYLNLFGPLGVFLSHNRNLPVFKPKITLRITGRSGIWVVSLILEEVPT